MLNGTASFLILSLQGKEHAGLHVCEHWETGISFQYWGSVLCE